MRGNGPPSERQPCPLGVCDGSGWILGPEDVARPCDCRDRLITRARSRGVASVIPAKYRGVSFDRPPVTQINGDVVKAVREYCADVQANLDAGRGLWFVGSSGTGKTTLAMLVSRIALEAGRTVAIYSLPKLLARIRRTFDTDGEQSYLEFFERLTSVDLLHLDDLGTEHRTDWVIEQLYALINERYEGKKAVMITTNIEDDQLEKQIGARIVSRLVEMCGDPLALYDEDRRVRFTTVAEPAASGGSASGSGAGAAGTAGLGPLDH